MLSLLQSAGTYIWRYRIHFVSWYLVCWLCPRRASLGTGPKTCGSTVVYVFFIIYFWVILPKLLTLLFLMLHTATVSWWKCSWPTCRNYQGVASLPYISLCTGFSLLDFLQSRIYVQVLGTPTREEIRCMNPNYTDFRFPQIKAHPWHKVCLPLVVPSWNNFWQLFTTSWVRFNGSWHGSPRQVFNKRMPPEAIDLASRLLQYSPSLRCTAVSLIFFF